MTARYSLCLLIALLTLTPLAAVAQKQALDHDDYDRWKEIDDYAISDDGAWALLTVEPPKGDGELRVKSLDAEQTYAVPRGTDARFTEDSRFIVFMIAPPYDSTRQARLDDVPDAEQPKAALGILDLASGNVTRIERVQSYQLPAESSAWVAYHREPPLTDSTADEEGNSGDENRAEAEGAPLVVRALSSGEEWTYEHATNYTLADAGNLLAFVAAPADSTQHGVHALGLTADGGAPTRTPLLMGDGDYPQLVVDEAGTQVAFLTNRDAPDDAESEHTLYHWQPGQDAAQAIAQSDNDAWPSSWLISEHGDLDFSEEGNRLFFGTAPPPLPEADADSLLPEEQVTVDVWNWKDPYLQPMQKEQVDERREQTYQAVYFVGEERMLQLGTEDVPNITVGADGEADVALGTTNRPYRQEMSWDWPPRYDAYLIDLETGEREQVLSGIQDTPDFSPDGQYIVWWNRTDRVWEGMTTGRIAEQSRARMTLSTSIPHPVYDETHDRPYPAGAYGLAGWTEDDEHVLIYDRYDVWAVDPMEANTPRAITEGRGRADSLQFRYIDLDVDEDAIDPSAPLLLSAFNTATKADGYYRDRVEGTQPPSELLMMDRSFYGVRKADEADRLLYRRESFQEYPDLWVSDLQFGDARKITDVNPQQSKYQWGTAELMEWTSLDGKRLQGILYKPEDFDPSQQYPMMVYFYERNSDDLHEHHIPAAGRSVINFTFYASRGYVIFVPDIPYKIGYPGESAMNAVMPGVTQLMDQGFIDRDNVGVQGHSWGGYQIAYMVTRTNLFAAAEAGAPVSNMISAYGGIRWGSGMSRMFQYEDTQSRIGGSLWEKPLRYIENSPIFWADKIETPLLMMHNDHDTAVPWEQGIELFVALRRLGKPAWLINYNDEPHWPTTLANKRDWTRRMQQFFDHYLKDAPAPIWLEEGVPAIEKGRMLGLEPVVTDPDR
jgi:dipeptidyl aminopeptidase/acylaminoacyl peptidase